MTALFPPQFLPFFESLSFESLPGSKLLVELWPETNAQNAEGKRFKKPACRLYQQGDTEVTVTGFRNLVLSHLRRNGHLASVGIADAVLGCAVRAAKTGDARATFLELALTQLRQATVSHFFVMPTFALGEACQFDGYVMGPINMGVLASRCRRAQSDYADLYRGMLTGHYALQSPEFKHTVVDFVKVGIDTKLLLDEFWRDLLLNYFTLLSRLHFEHMWEHLNRTQVLSSPFEAELLDVENLRSHAGMFAQRVSIYLDFSRSEAGYVVPEGGGVTLFEPNPASEFQNRFADHRAAFRLTEVGDTELGRVIVACAGFCQRAIRFSRMGRADEAALYATICLEHVLAEKGRNNDTVCTRAAVIAHRRFGMPYQSAEKEMQQLYDARSSFVHTGKSLNMGQAERLIEYARETIHSLLTLHLREENRTGDFFRRWVKDLNFVIAGMEAGHTLDEAILARAGVSTA